MYTLCLWEVVLYWIKSEKIAPPSNPTDYLKWWTEQKRRWKKFDFSSNVQNPTKCTLEQHTDQPNVQDKVITQPNVQDKTKPNMQDTTQLKN